MLPTINGKDILNCNENDFNIILDNTDYAESGYIDYKTNFSLLEYSKGDSNRNKALAEFRSDVCSFANADGGYLIYGIREDKGIAKEIIGIDILDDNTEKFQLERKNNLNTIMPKMPQILFNFVKLHNGKYLVVIFVKSDFYAPYIHIENEINYQIFKRVGNSKKSIGYTELKRMFNNSLSIENEILNYRQSRIHYFYNLSDTENNKYSQFLLLHIIPDTFMDSTHRKNLFVKYKKANTNFQQIFNSYGCSSWPIPNVDGLRFTSYHMYEECQLTNDCIAEAFEPLRDLINIGYRPDIYPNGFFAHVAVWENIDNCVRTYIEKMKTILDTQRIFVGISVIGCKDVVSEQAIGLSGNVLIDRNTIICHPIVVDNIHEDDAVELSMKMLQIEFLLSLGVKSNSTLKALIDEVYQ